MKLYAGPVGKWMVGVWLAKPDRWTITHRHFDMIPSRWIHAGPLVVRLGRRS